MEHPTRLRQLGLHVVNVLGEVGNQIKEHAKKASADLGNLSESAGFFCGKYSNIVKEGSCTLFVNKNDEFIYENHSDHTAAVLAGKGSSLSANKTKGINELVLNVEDGGAAIIASTSKGPISDVYKLISMEWYRKFSNREPTLVIGAISERYILSADDVGAMIIAKANVNLNNNPTILKSEMGPFDIDVMSRKKIENYLITGAAQFHVEADNNFDINNNSNTNSHNLSKIAPTFQSFKGAKIVLRVTTDSISSENLYTRDTWAVNYESTYPLLSLDIDSPKFEICFDKNRKMVFSAVSKHIRDVIVLTIRAFHGKKLMANSLNSNLTEEICAQVALGKLNTDLCKAIQAAEQAKIDLDAVKKEKIALEMEMKETITSFQEMQMHEKLNRDESSSKMNNSGDDEKLQNMLADALAENNRLGKLAQSQKMDLEKAIKEIGNLQSKLAKLASL